MPRGQQPGLKPPTTPTGLTTPQYIVRLIAQVITVSLETVKIVKSLPPLHTD